MSKLTDSEGEYHPADVEDNVTKTSKKNPTNDDKLQAFFDELDKDLDDSFDLSGDEKPVKPKSKMFRDLAEG